MPLLRPNVLAARERLTAGHADFLVRHRAGTPGGDLCAAMAALRDEVLLDLVCTALDDLGESGADGLQPHIALVAHGGYGRRDVAPYSDVDLMILHDAQVTDRVAPLAERLLRDVFDAGLTLGHSVRTPREACLLATSDPSICTSLIESRLLWGSESIMREYLRLFRWYVRHNVRRLIAGIESERLAERRRYGETVFLLEPNVKRSSGGLRDLQLIRWIGFVRYGDSEPTRLSARGLLDPADLRAILAANDFLLRLRNELHFHAGQSTDVLGRAEQLRIADLYGYQRKAGLLPVEHFMRDYFRHTAVVSNIAARLVARAQTRDKVDRLVTVLFGHRMEPGIYVGPAGIVADRRGLQLLGGDLAAVMRLVDMANLYDKPIAPATWESIRRDVSRLPKKPPSQEACRHFLSLLGNPARLGSLLRNMHDARLLERFIPEFHRTRGLLQFNQYHKYTVDEHCLRAVEFAAELLADKGPLGRVYRSLTHKHLLHLALLIHDLGKGCLEDHREVGLKIAAGAARRLKLPDQEAETLKFLVHKHMLLNHLAFRRDTADQQLAVQLAVQVGSPELMQMLYVLTAADLGAVGPGVWDGWKQEVVTDLYHRTMQHLAGESPETTIDDLADRRRAEIAELLGDKRAEQWYVQHLRELPGAYLNAATPAQAAADLRLLHDVGPGQVAVESQYLPETATVQFTVGTSESIVPGIFYRLTGALSSCGLQIRAAEIHTLPDGLVLDRFFVADPDYAGEPPDERMAQVRHLLLDSLCKQDNSPPAFRRTWLLGEHRPVRVPGVPTRVQIDNSTSAQFTIIDIFTHDRTGLLYTIARTLFELELSVGRAKIGTFLDQVVDVFYVTDRQNRKIADEHRLEQIRRRLIEVVRESATPLPSS